MARSDQYATGWVTDADSERNWTVAGLDFESLCGKSDQDVTFSVSVESDESTSDATATYDVTDPTSSAESPGDRDVTPYFHITWEAGDAFSGVGLVELWCKKEDLTGMILRDWSRTYYTADGKGEHHIDADFYYEIPEAEKYEDGRYFFAVKCFDVAGNEEPDPHPVVTFDYIAPINPNNPTGKEGGGGGCFIDALLPSSYY